MNDTDRDKMLMDMACDIATLKTAICGNGTKGLNDRMEGVETAIENIKNNRRKKSPLEILANTGVALLIAAAIIGGAMTYITAQKDIARIEVKIDKYMKP